MDAIARAIQGRGDRMTEQEAIMIIQAIPEKIWNQMDKAEEEAIKKAVKALEFQKTFTEKTSGRNVVIAIMDKDVPFEINGVNVYEAVEKQIPKKPFLDGEFIRYNKCPVCRTLLLSPSDKDVGFCHGCGQAVDWGE